MNPTHGRALAAALFAAALLAPPAPAQPPAYPEAPPDNTAIHMRPPNAVPPPPPQTMVNNGPATPPPTCTAPTVNPGAFAPPGYVVPGYVANQSRVYGYLSGTADMITANGQYLNSIQQARITQAQADQAQLGTRNAIIQQKMYEQSLIPTQAEKAQQDLWNNLQRARNNPSKTDIWYGNILNTFLTAFKQAEAQGIRAEPVPVESEVLARINVTTGKGGGVGAGLLRNLTRFDWPFALQDSAFKKDRENVETLTRQAVEQVGQGGVAADTFRKLSDTVGAMNDSVRGNKTMSPTDFIEARTYLDNFTASIQVLRDPNASSFFDGKFTLRGPTVADMVAQMASQGLSFAPATPGDEPAYTVLYQAMLAYDYRLSRGAH